MSGQQGGRQQQIMALLLNAGVGLSVDDIAQQLQISRTAVNQHLAGLEKQQFIKEAELNTNTGGRPARCYVLTPLGLNQFPKQYAWFGNLLLDELAQELGSEGLAALMRKLGVKLANRLAPQFANKNLEQRLALLVEIMQNLGYHAELEHQDGQPQIKATNCVYHDLAQQHPELCVFDQALINTLLSTTARQTACMAKGDCACQFRVTNKG